MSEIDPLETDMLAGAAQALRKRAARQSRIAADGTTHGDRATVRTGEAAIAECLAAVLSELAAEFEGALT